jgi:hypothetical protein
MSDRFVVLGVARPRSGWFGSVASWANTAIVPVDFLKCLTVEEAVARIRGSAVSAVLIDAGLAAAGHGLFEAATATDVAVHVVDDHRVDRGWTNLGASEVVPPEFDADDLVRLLHQHARPIESTAFRSMPDPAAGPEPSAIFHGNLVAVCGVRGCGASTVAIALAQGLATRPANRGSVVLADLALDADQAMYHDAVDVVPGLHDLVDAHRVGRPDGAAIRATLFEVTSRRYSLLLGLRRQRVWTALSGIGIVRSVEALSTAARWVVADIAPEFDGEQETGSIDVEERNALARAVVSRARCVVVVSDPSLRGLRRLPRICKEAVDLGVDPSRLLPVINRFEGSRIRRSEIHGALEALGLGGLTEVASALILPARRDIETRHANVDPMPERLVEPLVGAVESVVTRLADVGDDEREAAA